MLINKQFWIILVLEIYQKRVSCLYLYMTTVCSSHPDPFQGRRRIHTIILTSLVPGHREGHTWIKLQCCYLWEIINHDLCFSITTNNEIFKLQYLIFGLFYSSRAFLASDFWDFWNHCDTYLFFKYKNKFSFLILLAVLADLFYVLSYVSRKMLSLLMRFRNVVQL